MIFIEPYKTMFDRSEAIIRYYHLPHQMMFLKSTVYRSVDEEWNRRYSHSTYGEQFRSSYDRR